MTSDDINAAVAVEVMGWRWHPVDPSTPEIGHWLTKPPALFPRIAGWFPDTDPRDSRMVVERMRELGYWITLAMSRKDISDTPYIRHPYLCSIQNETGRCSEVESDSLDLAICEATLEAVRAGR